MISFLSRVFIPDYQDISSPSVRQAYGMLCGAVGIGLNILLFLGKLLAGMLSGSIAITADAFNNLSDAGSSVITLIGFKMAGQKPDPEHPFGHGRIEYISGLLVSIAVLLMAYELARSSVQKLLHPEDVACSLLIVGILLASILTKLYMCYYNKTLGKKLASAAMSATAADSISDALSTTLVLVSTLVGYFTGYHIDGWCGILVAIFICCTGIQAMKETMNPLLGQSPDREFVERVKEIVCASPVILGIHDLIVHDYGPGRVMLTLHAEVSAKGDILAIHDEIDNIERKLQEELSCTATIHMDPIVTDNTQVTKMKAQIKALLREINPDFTFHDFRLVEGTTHTNLIFDVVVPYDCPMTDAEVISEIKERIRKLPGSYFGVINIDRDFVEGH